MVTQTGHPGVYMNEVPGQPTITGVSATIAGFVGRCKKGPTNKATLVSGFTMFEDRYGKGFNPNFSYMPFALKGYFEEGGQNAYVARAVGANAEKASGNLKAYATAPAAGTVLSANAGPFAIVTGQTLVIAIDAAGDQTFTFVATQATRPGSGAAFNTIAGAETLLLKIDGGSVQTIIFQGGDTTAAAVEARINGTLVGGAAVLNGGQVDIRSDRFGTGSSVQITGGTGLAKIGHTIGTTTGSGDASDLSATTAAEVVSKLSTLSGATAAVQGSRVRVTSSTTGSNSKVQVKGSSTATALGFDFALHVGGNSGTVNTLAVTANNEGAWGNDLKINTIRWKTTATATLANGATSLALAQVRNVQKGDLVWIVDPANGNFTVVHVNAIDPNAKTISFLPCSLSIPGSPLASGSSASSSSMHRRVTTLSAAVASTDVDLPLSNAFGIVVGAELTIDDGTNLADVEVASVSGSTVRLTVAVGFDFASGVMVASQEFGLDRYEAGELKEPGNYFSMSPENVSDYVGKRLAGVANESNYRIVVADLGAEPTPLCTRIPRPEITALSGGLDGDDPTPEELLGEDDPATGLHLLDVIPDVSRFCSPGETDPTWVLGAVAYAEGQIHKSAITFYYDAPLSADTVEKLQNYRFFDTNVDSSWAALYAPWYWETDPNSTSGQGIVFVPPTGRVLGQVASTIANRGVQVAAANVALHNVLGLTADITDAMQDELNDFGINVIRSFRGEGVRIWGARTNASLQDGRQFLPIREALNYIKLSIEKGVKFAVFQPNDSTLWTLITSLVVTFLHDMWRNGQLAPADDPDRAYFVKCDAETNTQTTINAGQVITQIGVQLPPPAEKLVFNIGTWNGGSSIDEVIAQRG